MRVKKAALGARSVVAPVGSSPAIGAASASAEVDEKVTLRAMAPAAAAATPVFTG